MHRMFQTLILVGSLIFHSVISITAEAIGPEIESSTKGTESKEPVGPPLGLGDPDSFPEIVARVNDSSIKKQSFLERAVSIQSDMGLPEGNLPLEIYRTILNEMIDMELLYQASQARNFRPDPEELERQYRALVARFPSEEAFLKQLGSQAITSQQFKDLMYKDLSVQELVSTELAPRVSVSEEAKLKFYNENSRRMEQPAQLRLSHILIGVKRGASSAEREEARQKIEEIRRKALQPGTDFTALAREFSEDPATREQGGELLIQSGQTVPAFEQIAFGLEVGAISDIVETQFGYHVLKLFERIPARELPYQEAESMIQQILEQQELQTIIKSEVEKLRQEASVELFI